MRDGATRAVWYLWSLQVVDTRGIDLGYFIEGVVCPERAVGTIASDFGNCQMYVFLHFARCSSGEDVMIFLDRRRSQLWVSGPCGAS